MVTIKKATLDDCQLIHEMAKQVFPLTYKDILSPEQIMYMMNWMYSVSNLTLQIKGQGHIYFIAYCDEQAAGYVSIQPQGENVFHLQKIYVLPAFQKMQLGKMLFRHAICAIKELHPAPCRMELNVNRRNPALHFYEKMGMKKLTEGDFDIGNGFLMNDFIMTIDI